MGAVRKTMSVGTFGLVSFRSNEEQLRRAERAQLVAERALEREHTARVAAESRISAAENRVARAGDAAERAAQRLERSRSKAKSKRDARRAERIQHFLDGVEPAGRRARALAEQSAQEAKRGAKHTWRRAHDAALTTKDAVAPPVERAVARATEAIDNVTG